MQKGKPLRSVKREAKNDDMSIYQSRNIYQLINILLFTITGCRCAISSLEDCATVKVWQKPPLGAIAHIDWNSHFYAHPTKDGGLFVEYNAIWENESPPLFYGASHLDLSISPNVKVNALVIKNCTLYPPDEFMGRLRQPSECLPVVAMRHEIGKIKYPNFECISYQQNSLWDNGEWCIPKEDTLIIVTNAIPGGRYVTSPLSYPIALSLTPFTAIYDILLGIPRGTLRNYIFEDFGRIGKLEYGEHYAYNYIQTKAELTRFTQHRSAGDDGTR